VFGVPDEMWGERVHAAIVLKEGHHATPEAISQFCRFLSFFFLLRFAALEGSFAINNTIILSVFLDR